MTCGLHAHVSVCSRCKIAHECISSSGGSSTGTNRRTLVVCERSTCALVCVRRRNKRVCVSNCDCGATHSCTAGHAFSAGLCHTASRWRSWRRNLAPDDACCCRLLSLWPPSPFLSAALFLGSYPAEEQEQQAQREFFGVFLKCKIEFTINGTCDVNGYNIAKKSVSEAGCLRVGE